MVNQPGVGVCVRVVLVCRRVCRRVCRPVCARAPMMVTEGLRRRLGWNTHSPCSKYGPPSNTMALIASGVCG